MDPSCVNPHPAPPAHPRLNGVLPQGLSVLDTYKVARQNGRKFKWRHGEYIAILSIPDDAPFTYKGPEHRGHWMIYDAEGNMLEEKGAELLRRSYVVRVVHGPSTEEGAL
jgi:hypothetical protein